MTVANTGVLSAQEAAIESGKKVLHRTVTDRVLRIFEAIRTYGPPRVALEHVDLFTESFFKTTEGQPLVWRWAKALKHIAENISVAIFDDELIVGRPNTWFGRYGAASTSGDGGIRTGHRPKGGHTRLFKQVLQFSSRSYCGGDEGWSELLFGIHGLGPSCTPSSQLGSYCDRPTKG